MARLVSFLILAGVGLALFFLTRPAGAETLEGLQHRLEPHITVHRPQGVQGPVPAVIILSGCGGVRANAGEYAEAANNAGFAAIVVDSHAARGIGRFRARTLVCTGIALRGQRRAGDLFAVIDWAKDQPGIDGERLAAAGWSHGGWTLLDALSFAEAGIAPPGLDRLPDAPLAGLKAGLLVYPYCGRTIRADQGAIAREVPLTAWLGGRDAIAPAKDCQALFERYRTGGVSVDATFYPDLTHAFDAPDQSFDPRMQYDEAATRAAHARFAGWLETHLGSSR